MKMDGQAVPNSSFPEFEVVSAAGFWTIADAVLVDPHTYGVGEIAKAERYPNLCPLIRVDQGLQMEKPDYERLLSARIIYVVAHVLNLFASAILPKLPRPVVIMTGTTDENIGPEWAALADDPRVIHWYAQNVNFIHPKVTPIPIGIANENWPHGSKADLVRAMAEEVERRPACYMNYKLTNQGVRMQVAKRFVGQPYVRLEGRQPFPDYLRALKACRFCLSPPGAGIDCHRTWESLYVGTVPLVSAGPWMSGFTHLPMIAVDDWLTIEWADIQRAGDAIPPFDPSSIPELRMSWWADRIRRSL